MLILYLILAVAYSVVVPIGRGADEWAHYWYAQFIAQNRRLPTTPAEREAAGYKSDWPPLYHLLAAGVTAWIETDGPPTFKYREDNIRRQLVPAQGPEAILHTEDELFPWQQEILVWHLGRFLSIGFSVGTLIVTYFIALEVFEGGQVAGSQVAGGRVAGSQGRRIASSRVAVHNSQFTTPALRPDGRAGASVHNSQLALLATAVLAFNPRFLFTGMLFNYDSLTLLLASLFLWLAIRVAKGYHSRWGFWGLGALAGLALVTKYLAALLPVVVMLVASRRVAGSQGRRVAGSQSRRGAGAQVAEEHASRTTHHAPRLTSHSLWKYLAQAVIAYLFVTGWWFGYLILNFNEIDTYGPVLGTLAPLIRGDASDRTVEEVFALLSGGQAPPPDYIERKSYTAWQIIAGLPTTFWGNAVIRPYPLNWFVWTMTIVTLAAAIGIGLLWRTSKTSRFWLNLLLLLCALPVPFMLIRLFGARDALEAVQGRHILFLAGPAVAILLVRGLSVVTGSWSVVSGSVATQKSKEAERPENIKTEHQGIRSTQYAIRFTFYAVLALLLTGAVSQLIFMQRAYPPLLPVRTMPLPTVQTDVPSVTLPGGARLLAYQLVQVDQAFQMTLVWQGGGDYAPQDYRMELRLVGESLLPVRGWNAFQTQGRYPSRAWEANDVIKDVGWLPLTGLAAGDYELQWRILGNDGPLFDWQMLTSYTLWQMTGSPTRNVTVWRHGRPAQSTPVFSERETAQLTFRNPQADTQNQTLIAPGDVLYRPVAAGPGWANFIIQPHWPAGDYRLEPAGRVILRVAASSRSFQMPAEMSHPLKVNFDGQLKLLGYTLPSRRVEPGAGLPITLYWQGLQWMGEDFVIFSRLLDNQQIAYGGYDRLAKENYSTLLWAPEEVVTDGFAVPVDPDAPDGVYTLSLGWYRQVEGQASSLPLLNPETGEPTGETAVTIGPIKVGGPPLGVTVERTTPQNEVNIALGNKIELLGFDERFDASALELTFYWQALAPPAKDYTVFVHVRNATGEVVAQQDGPPAGGVYPTGLWDAGEIIRDEVSVPLGQLEQGAYTLAVGMYDFETGERLAADSSPDGAIILWSFELGE